MSREGTGSCASHMNRVGHVLNDTSDTCWMGLLRNTAVTFETHFNHLQAGNWMATFYSSKKKKMEEERQNESFQPGKTTSGFHGHMKAD